jgi:hypothetical protein
VYVTTATPASDKSKRSAMRANVLRHLWLIF